MKSARICASRSCSVWSRKVMSNAGCPAPPAPASWPETVADSRRSSGTRSVNSTTAGSDVANASSTAAISSGLRVTWLNGMPDMHLGKKSRNNPLKCKTDPSAASAIAASGMASTNARQPSVFGAPIVDGCSADPPAVRPRELLASAPGATAAAATATRPAISAAASFKSPKTKSRKRITATSSSASRRAVKRSLDWEAARCAKSVARAFTAPKSTR